MSDDTTPNGELRALVEEWRENHAQNAYDTDYPNIAGAFEVCARELEEVLDEYE